MLPHTLRFSKMHGAGNDFVVLDLRGAEAPSPELCRMLADRHRGIGCDLILGVEAPRSETAAASFRIWTGEGLPSTLCGNGARCVAAWAVRAGLARGPRFALDSPSGTHEIDVLGERTFRVTLGVPRFEPEQVPMLGFGGEQSWYDMAFEDGTRVRFAGASMGNPHAVIEVDDIEAAPVDRIGRLLQGSDRFPQSVNVGFVEIVSRDLVRLRVYEFGAGETLACGSGACAAAAVLMRMGRIDRQACVSMPGGDLHVAWPSPTEPVTMTGPAAFVFEGHLDT
ncbi:diaminopimelate epimerase [Burkholderia lata]|uniref:diaminopimelate epimerase n=1 Tax=Burkholderia lata (strain ATCC 17760 / DSM 23089 / LMG 22485 / NCIMB 9086 / R18194 / 383) TaxID=482957 RepID=UPI001C2E4E39|nr:diaminopimelate epimerase [Burkholderia lata]